MLRLHPVQRIRYQNQFAKPSAGDCDNFCVGRPEVIYRYENVLKLQPIERLMVDFEERFMGVVTEKLSLRKGRMVNLVNNENGSHTH